MKRLSPIFVSFLILLITSSLRAGDLIDRIVATVNGHIILQSDWDTAVSWEALSSLRSLDRMTTDDRKAVLDRLIDQKLLREQFAATETQHASDEQIEKRIAEIRELYPSASTEEGWKALLQSFGLSASEVKEKTGTELDLLKMVDSKLRPTIQIDEKNVEAYYSQELLPQLRQAGQISLSLNQATPKIKEVLTQQKMNEALTTWLHTLRIGSQIQTVPGTGESVQ